MTSSAQVENSFSVSVPIFKQFHRNIIGKGGSNIKKVPRRSYDQSPPSGFGAAQVQFDVMFFFFPSPFLLQIREETNTRIDLPAENSNSEMIVITGKKANCEAARNRILAIQKELVSARRASPSHAITIWEDDGNSHLWVSQSPGQYFRD